MYITELFKKRGGGWPLNLHFDTPRPIHGQAITHVCVHEHTFIHTHMYTCAQCMHAHIRVIYNLCVRILCSQNVRTIHLCVHAHTIDSYIEVIGAPK